MEHARSHFPVACDPVSRPKETDSTGIYSYFSTSTLVTQWPYGEEITNQTQDDLTHRYTGHERDFESNLDYMHARYYSPFQGRFLGVDPHVNNDLELSHLWNRYAYAANNPLRNTDPYGTDTEDTLFQNPDIVTAVIEMWKDSNPRALDQHDRREIGAYVVEDSAGNITVERVPFIYWPQFEYRNYTDWPDLKNGKYNGRKVLAMIHTHPFERSAASGLKDVTPLLTSSDIEQADEKGVPIYAVAHKYIYKYDPKEKSREDDGRIGKRRKIFRKASKAEYHSESTYAEEAKNIGVERKEIFVPID